MSQKTLTVNGQKFTAKQITKLMDDNNMTNGDDYIVILNGEKYFANYRQEQDPPFAPVCDANKATHVALMPDNGSYHWSVWLTL